MNHLASRQLSDAEWDEFVNRLDRLVEELALLAPSCRPPNNLNNCRRRRRNRRGNPTSHSQPNRSAAPTSRRLALSQSSPTSALSSSIWLWKPSFQHGFGLHSGQRHHHSTTCIRWRCQSLWLLARRYLTPPEPSPLQSGSGSPPSSTGSGYTLDNGTTIRQLAYADDVCLFGSSQEDISCMLSIVHEFGVWSGLKLNVQKCGCLSVINNSSRGRYVWVFSTLYGDQAIPSLKWEDSYRYLGISFGRPRQGSNDELSDSVLGVAEKILSSKLTEWQKMEAVNMFAVSKTDHFLHTSSANSSWADSLDSRIRKLVKKHLRLPVRTNCAFLHLSARRGGLGLCSISQAWDRATITRAIKSLSSLDRTV